MLNLTHVCSDFMCLLYFPGEALSVPASCGGKLLHDHPRGGTFTPTSEYVQLRALVVPRGGQQGDGIFQGAFFSQTQTRPRLQTAKPTEGTFLISLY
uniref:Uncharacterized protein n=1 Tax=Gasterosteus aculeatus aculeatus TaxID=481459 RepID=A0AAQ4PPH3_GASAC